MRDPSAASDDEPLGLPPPPRARCVHGSDAPCSLCALAAHERTRVIVGDERNGALAGGR